MEKLKVYISSTFLDLEIPRETIIKKIQEGLKDNFELTNIMEHMKWDKDNRTDIDICLAEVKKADIYIILLGKRYGSHPEKFLKKGIFQQNVECKSYTELEYDAACNCLKEKFYGLYKLELTDAFFDDMKIDFNDYVDVDPQKIKKMADFSAKIAESKSPVKINSLQELNSSVNDILGEFRDKRNTIISLKIDDSDKNSIDRKEAFEFVSNFPFGGGAYTLFVEIENDNDCYMEFTRRMQAELVDSEKVKKINFINSNQIISIDPEKKITEILRSSSPGIYGEKQNGISFEGLANDLPTIRNVFIGFVVNLKLDLPSDRLNFMEVISLFIKKIDSILKAKEFKYNFYFIIYGLSPKNECFPQASLDLFQQLQFISIGRLPDVQKEDAVQWLTEILKRNTSIETEVETLFQSIFLGDEQFPSKYQNCINLIEKRTKSQQ